MGEWSRRVGEIGEEIVGDLLQLFGWENAKRNVTIDCLKNEKHARPSSEKRATHGIDCLFTYPSQLQARVLDHLLISSKYTSDKYPDSPSTQFKSHLRDLSETMECFKFSGAKLAANKSFSGIESTRDIGILFWLSDGSEADHDLVSKLINVRNVDEFMTETVYVVDNYRASFIYDTITATKFNYNNSIIEFLYFNTGINYNPALRDSSGSILPVDYLNSNILPLKLIDPDGNKKLVLAINENFSRNRLMRSIGLCQELTSDFASGVDIIFPDFNKLKHENDVYEAKLHFTDQRFVGNIEVRSIKKDFRS
jgi:hypothetical protein